MRENFDGFKTFLQNERLAVSEEEFETGLDLTVRGAETFNTGDHRDCERTEELLGVAFRGDGLTVR